MQSFNPGISSSSRKCSRNAVVHQHRHFVAAGLKGPSVGEGCERTSSVGDEGLLLVNCAPVTQ